MKQVGKRGASTRRDLLDAAQGQFLERGFVGARLTDIAAAAGLTTGAFYRHFPTKGDVVNDLVEELVDQLSSALVEARNLEDFCRIWLTVHQQHQGAVRAAENLTVRDDRMWAHRRRLRRLWASSALQHLPLVRDSHRRRILSLVLVDVLDYYFFTCMRGWTSSTVDAVATNLALLFTEGLYGDDVDRDPGRGSPAPPARVSLGSPRFEVEPEAVLTLDWRPDRGRAEPSSPRGKAQRNAILQSAARVFMITGYEAAGIPQIADVAGVSAGTVYRYFTDKRDIFMCLLSHAEHNLLKQSLWPLGPDGRLQVKPAMLTYLAARERERAVFRVWREMIDSDEELERLWIRTRQHFQTVIACIVRNSQKSELVSPSYDADIVAELLVALCDGPAHGWYDLGWDEQGITLEDLADVLATRISSGKAH